jgi:peptidoglycan/LPS O-acetylase OafA/YrhL
MLNNSNPPKQLNIIQVYRGLAALLVVLHHANDIFNQDLHQDFLFNIFGFGWAGVDFFFVLSGFIIFYIHQFDIGKKSKFKPFIIKRFIRIYPLYWIVLTCKIAASLVSASGEEVPQRSLSEIVKAFLLFPQDRHILNTSFIGVSWTLSYEIFFYIIFGLLLLIKTKFILPIITAWVMGVILNLIGIFDFSKASYLLQFIFNERNLEFLLGCFTAYLIFKDKIKYGMILTSISAFWFTLSAINTNYEIVKISPVISYGIPFMLLILGAVSLEKSQSFKVPSLFIHIGNASYAIYLMHAFLMSNLAKFLTKLMAIFHLDGVLRNLVFFNVIAIIIIIVTVTIGCAIYSYMEKPLTTLLRQKILPSKAKISQNS